MHLTLPDSWQVRDVPDEYQAATYIAMGPRGYLGYSPSAVVTYEEGVSGTLDDWAAAMIEESSQTIPGLHVIDVGGLEIAGHPAIVHALSMTVETVNVTQMQFALLTGGRRSARRPGYVVTVTCASADLPTIGDSLIDMATSFEPSGGEQ